MDKKKTRLIRSLTCEPWLNRESRYTFSTMLLKLKE